MAYIGYNDAGESYRKKQQYKIAFHSLLNLKFASRWFKFLRSDEFKFVYSARPNIYIKPFRPYISIKWDKDKKIKVILDSYKFLQSKGDIFHQILNDGHKILATFMLMDKDNKQYSLDLKLGYIERFRKEGELVLYLHSRDMGEDIAYVAFSFENNNDNISALIGSVQGHISNKEYATKIIQKLMYGIRPISFIIFAIQVLAKSLKCKDIYCAGDKIHTYRRKHAIAIPWNYKINFDYDKFYKEVGGEKTKDNWFKLPLQEQRKDMKDIKSKKRSLYKKRYALLDDISLQIQESLK